MDVVVFDDGGVGDGIAVAAVAAEATIAIAVCIVQWFSYRLPTASIEYSL